MIPTRAALPFLLLSLACASTPPGPTKPAIDIIVRGTVHMDRSGEGPVNVNVVVRNEATEPITVRRIRVESREMIQFAVAPAERYVVEKIGPGETKVIEVSATAYRTSSQRLIGEPLTLRAVVEYDATNGHRYRQTYIDNSVFE
jgi:hypothetical protein